MISCFSGPEKKRESKYLYISFKLVLSISKQRFDRAERELTHVKIVHRRETALPQVEDSSRR
jgi:hypothetical protein